MSRLAGFARAAKIGAAVAGAVLILGVCGSGVPASGQTRIYQWTDANGVVHFSNSYVPDQHTDEAEVRVMRKGSSTPRAPRLRSIPLFTVDGRKLVRALLEGQRKTREVLLIVDTGAQSTLIDDNLAQDLGLEFVSEAGIMGVTGVAKGWIGRLRRIEVGNNTLRDWRILVGPVPGTLLLGMDVLEKLQLTIGADQLEQRSGLTRQ